MTIYLRTEEQTMMIYLRTEEQKIKIARNMIYRHIVLKSYK